MNQVIKIQQSESGIAVSGRELHEFLGVKTKYNDWFPRMKEYGFVENTDYLLVSQKRATKNPKNPVAEYADHIMKLDMAKEIAMIQRNEKGKLARQYFIEIEKEYNSPEKVMARALMYADEKIKSLDINNKVLEQKISELKPKADYTDIILKNKSLVKITSIAKDYGMSGKAMNELLHNLKIQYKSGTQWLLYSKYQACGYTHSETVEFTRSNGLKDVNLITKWTQKGRLFLYDILKKNGVIPIIEVQE